MKRRSGNGNGKHSFRIRFIWSGTTGKEEPRLEFTKESLVRAFSYMKGKVRKQVLSKLFYVTDPELSLCLAIPNASLVIRTKEKAQAGVFLRC